MDGIGPYGNAIEPPGRTCECATYQLLADPCGPRYLEDRPAQVGRPDQVVRFSFRRADSHSLHGMQCGGETPFRCRRVYAFRNVLSRYGG